MTVFEVTIGAKHASGAYVAYAAKIPGCATVDDALQLLDDEGGLVVEKVVFTTAGNNLHRITDSEKVYVAREFIMALKINHRKFTS